MSLTAKLIAGAVLVSLSLGALAAYNRAITKVEELGAENRVLKNAVRAGQNALDRERRLRVEAEVALARRAKALEEINDAEVSNVTVVAEASGDCLDVPMPTIIVDKLRAPRSGSGSGDP